MFDSSSFKDNEDIYFKVKSIENNFNIDNIVKYIYVSSQSETPGASAYSKTTALTGDDKETLENTAVFDIKYFAIKSNLVNILSLMENIYIIMKNWYTLYHNFNI